MAMQLWFLQYLYIYLEENPKLWRCAGFIGMVLFKIGHYNVDYRAEGLPVNSKRVKHLSAQCLLAKAISACHELTCFCAAAVWIKDYQFSKTQHLLQEPLQKGNPCKTAAFAKRPVFAERHKSSWLPCSGGFEKT